MKNYILQKILTNQQNQDLLSLVSKMSNELGGMDNTNALINILVTEIVTQCNPYETQIISKMKTMKKSGKKVDARKKQAFTMLSQMVNNGTISKVITGVKKRFTQKQCDVAFKYLPPKYFKLGLYAFKATPCTGKGQ